MLLSLHIKDFAIIDELAVSFAPGLNIITGETGAGKTIVVEAINLILGGRAQTDLIRSGSDKANVTAVFDAADLAPGVASWLSEHGIEFEDEIIVHRVLGSGGKGRISVNGVPVTAARLRDIGDRLIDISSQHEHQLLLDRGEHVRILDSFGGLHESVGAYRELHRQYAELACEVKKLEDEEREAKDKLEYLKYQLDEIRGANLQPGEDEDIESKRSRLKHAVALEEKVRLAEAILYRNAGSVIEGLDQASRLLAECKQFDSAASKWLAGLESARAEVDDVARDLAGYADSLESDPSSLEDIEERLHLIRRLIKKHGGSIEACFSRACELETEVEAIENYDEVLASKRRELENLWTERSQAAERLSGERRRAAESLSRAIEQGLEGLGMSRTKFEVSIERLAEQEWDESGPDRIEFMLSPNVGEPVRPLARIASGGELSRVMLVLKGALAQKVNLTGTSIFDEVDSGIGGAVAEVVGNKLKDVARSRQVICITHLPQIAVYGEKHIRISKHLSQGRTVTAMEELISDERAREIARMLGGLKVTDATLTHAVEMLRFANRP